MRSWAWQRFGSGAPDAAPEPSEWPISLLRQSRWTRCPDAATIANVRGEWSGNHGTNDMEAAAGRTAPQIGASRRLLLSLGLALSPALGEFVPIPGLELAPGAPGSRNTTSVMALGIGPVVSAYIAVELVALLVPRWNRLRHGMPDGRQQLNRAVATLALVIAACQALAMALMLEANKVATDVDRLLVVLTLSGATSLMMLIASAIERLGVVSGVLALIVVERLIKVGPLLPKIVAPNGALPLLAIVASLILPVLATWAAVRAFEPPRGIAPGAGRLSFSLPASSLQPVGAAASLLAMPSALHDLHLPFDVFAPVAELVDGPFALEFELGAALVLAVVFSVLLQQPSVVTQTRAALDPTRDAPGTRAVWRSLAFALVPTLAFTVVLVVCDHVLSLAKIPTPLSSALALACALMLDARRAASVYRSAPDLVCVAEERRPYALGPLLAAAERQGLRLQVSGVAATSLLRVFGPFAAMRLLCPASEADQAGTVLAELFDRESESFVESVLVAPPPARELEWNRAAGIVTTLGALSVLLLLFEGSPRPPREVGPVVLRGSFEVSLVDDESNPFEAEAAGLPSGVAILREEVPTRSVRYPTVARSFVRLVLQSGETLEQARRRVAPWLAARPVPPDRRLVWGEVHDDEGESFRSDRDTRIVDKISAFRTYLLVGDPILTIADLESATLNRDADHRYFVGLHLKPAGAERFWAATARHRQERIAILVGGVVRFVPTIESEIGGGYVQISMGEGEPELTKARAERLYRELRGSAP